MPALRIRKRTAHAGGGTVEPETARRALAVRMRRSLERIRSGALILEREFAGAVRRTSPALRASARNLLHYLALRQHDIRALQNDLASLGLSSLGRLEAHTLASLDAVLSLLDGLCGRPAERGRDAAAPCTIRDGSATLTRHADAVLGPSPAERKARIMVTMPSEAAQGAGYIHELVAQGMNIMRINCAHDGPEQWGRMISHLRTAEKKLGRSCLISFDLAGPKLRTGPIRPGPRVARWRPKRNRLGQADVPARVRFCAVPMEGEAGETVIDLEGDLVARARVGDRISLVDARGRNRTLSVVLTAAACCVCEASKTAYVMPRTNLVLRRGKRTVGYGTIIGIPETAESIRLRAGDELDIVTGDAPGQPAVTGEGGRIVAPAVVGCSLPEVVGRVLPGHRVFLDDGRIFGVVSSKERGRMRVKITGAIGGSAKLWGEKGINLPDTDLRLPALTAKDREDLAFVARHGDLVALSFVQRPRDVEALLRELRRRKASRMGIVLKIETRLGFSQLPALLLAAMRHPAVAVMVARGDLGVEVGFERLSEVQEEILWLCEAAHVPVIWATQVLESLAKGGMPSRAEITDAAMGSRAECVMLNKGPYILKTLKFLCDVLNRMADHQTKKTSLLRKLRISDLRAVAARQGVA